MDERSGRRRAPSPEALGGILVIVGLALFIAVFSAVFPVLRNPTGTYDRWFPAEGDSAAAERVDADVSEEPSPAFRFVAEAVPGDAGDPTYQARFEDRSEPGEAAIISRVWEFGDGARGRGATPVHSYDSPGNYLVNLRVVDENGDTASVDGDVVVPTEGRFSGRSSTADDFGLAGIGTAFEDAVASFELSADGVRDAVGSIVRRTGVVMLFALAAVASTIVAWRVTRAGILLMRSPEKLRLNVKSADVHVTGGRAAVDRRAFEEMEAGLVDA